MRKYGIRKNRARNKRRRKRNNRRQNAVACLVFFSIVVAAFGVAGKASRKLSEMDAARTAEATVQGSVLQEETSTGGTGAVASETSEAHLQRVAREAEEQGYPQAVIDLLEKNPETVDFVENYGEHQDVLSDGNDELQSPKSSAKENVDDEENTDDEENVDGEKSADDKENANDEENIDDEENADINGKSERTAEIKSAELNTEGNRNGIPLYIQWDARWGYEPFGTSIIGVSGCGATCMAMVVAGLTEDDCVTPDVMASYESENGYIDDDNNTYWSFMREGGSRWGVNAEQGMLSETTLAAELDQGHPVICSMGPGDFTDQGHFIVLVAYEDGNVTVNDPFSLANSEKTWVFSDIESQTKNMWVFWTED